MFEQFIETFHIMSEISGFYVGGYEDYSLVGYSAL
jgi:hypothetical protein